MVKQFLTWAWSWSWFWKKALWTRGQTSSVNYICSVRVNCKKTKQR